MRRELPVVFGVSALLFHLLCLPKFQMTFQARPGLDAFPGAVSWLVYPWEARFASTCGRIPSSIKDVVRHAGRDEDRREVLFVRIGDEHMTQRDAQVLAQQTLCGLDSVAKSIGWTKPHVRKNMFRMSVVVDSSQLSMANWLTCAKCMLSVIKAIQPFVSPFYDRMPGLISVVDPPFVAKKAWYMVRPWLGQPTREVVRFVQTEPSEQLPEQPKSDGADDTQKFWLLHNA